MNNKLKKILLIGASILMFTSVGASFSSTNVSARHVRAHRLYRHNKHTRISKRWHAGMPKVLCGNIYWISNFRPAYKYELPYRYIRLVDSFNSKIGYGPVAFGYKYNKKFISNGDGSGSETAYPHYRNLGHGWYIVTDGSMYRKNSLYNELHGHDANGMTSLIKIRNKRSMSVWDYQHSNATGKKHYDGTFHSYFSKKKAMHVLGTKW